ncbi:MAG: DUF2065 domain-containing protein [Syntrophales bacterium]|nr:DUF2065 domain-containing protein [Syntrophales bacterium]
MKFLLCVLGMVFIIEGLPHFVFPEKIKTYLMRLAELPPATLRISGLLAIIAGLILVYFGRR